MATKEERLAPIQCVCGDPVLHGELMSHVGPFRGHYECVKGKLGAENFLKAVELELIPLIQLDAFQGRKLHKFVGQDSAEIKKKMLAITDFIKSLEVGNA